MGKIEKGDTVSVERLGGLYRHYGTYVGEGRVIQRVKEGVRWSTLDDFSQGSPVYYERSPNPEETVKRAESRLGENGYDLITNNCEHFARSCKGEGHRSTQVEDVVSQIGHGFGKALDEIGDLISALF